MREIWALRGRISSESRRAVLFAPHLSARGRTGSGPLLMGTLWYGLSAQALRAARGEKVTVEQMFEGFQFLLPTLLWGLGLSALAVVLLVIALPVLMICVPLSSTRPPSWPSRWCLRSAWESPCCRSSWLPCSTPPPCFHGGLWHGRSGGDACQPAHGAKQSQRMAAALGRLGAAAHVGLACCVGSLFTTPWMAVALAEGYRLEQLALGVPVALRN